MIGKGITALILSSTAIKSRINNGENLKPISDYGKTSGDSIFYIVRAMPGYTKNGATMTKWNVTLVTQCKYYADSWDLSILLKQLFDSQQQKTHAGFKFTNLKCTSITDDYEFVLNGYGQTIQFEITTPNYSVEIE